MKKSILSILTLALVAVGCQNYDDQFDSLNKDIAALTTKVNAIDSGLASQITSVANSVSALATQLTTIGNAALTTADLTTALAGVLADIADTQAALTALDADVATDVAGVQTTVNDLVTQLVATDGAIADIAADVIANGTGVAANGTAVAANGTAIASNGTAVAANGTAIATNGTAIASNGTAVAANGTAIADVDADLVLTDTQIAAILTLLTEVSNNALTDADVAALAEVANLNAEMDALQAGLDELLAAQASVQGISITNQATLDYVETLVETDGTPANYIVNGDVLIDASVAANYSTGYIAAINELTKLVASVIGNVTITTADTDAALSIEQLTYVSGAMAITGKMPSGFIVGTTASLALDVEEADITLASLTSAAGGVTINIAGTTTITNVAIANLTNGSVTTSAGTLNLANADVNLGSGHPAADTDVKSLIAGNATDALTSANIAASGDVTLGSKVVSGTTIDAGGALTLSSAVAGSVVSGATFTSGGDINIAALALGSSTFPTSASAITTDGGAGGSITLGATSSAAAFTATASGSTVNAGSLADISNGLATFAATGVTLTGLSSNTGGLTVNTATSLDLPALQSSAGAITGAAVTSLSAPLLTTDGGIDIAALSTIAVKALGAQADLVDIATVANLTVTEQDADLDLSTAVKLVTLTYTGATASAVSTEDTDLTYGVYTSVSSLTTVSLAGGMGDVLIKAPLLSSLTTADGSTVRTLTTSGTALTSISLGHQGYNGGAKSSVSIVDTKITTLSLANQKWLGTITVTGNTSMTTMTMPTATAAADNVNTTIAGGGVAVTVTGNALAGAWTASVSATVSNLYTEGSFSTAPGITGAKTWLDALNATVNIAVASITYNIEIDDASAAMVANNNSTALNGGNIDTAAELALLPN